MAVYREQPALHAGDDLREGFRWVDCENRNESILAFLRLSSGARSILAVCNFAPVPRPVYPLGIPEAGEWEVLLSSADFDPDRDGVRTGEVCVPTEESMDGWAGMIRVDIPAFGIVFIAGPS